MDSKKRAIGATLAALLVIGVVVVVLIGGGDAPTQSPPDREGTALAPISPAPTPGIVDAPTPPPASPDDPRRVATAPAASGTTRPPSSAPAARPADPMTPPVTPKPAPGTDPWDEYAEETRRIVTGSRSELGEVASAIVSAFQSSDAPTLGSLLAPDEGSQDEYLADLAGRYPAIATAELGANVNVFAQGQATIYIAYAVVTWTDAGITSTHTIAIPMRYVDGQWHLTCLTDTDGELVFVQSVNL